MSREKSLSDKLDEAIGRLATQASKDVKDRGDQYTKGILVGIRKAGEKMQTVRLNEQRNKNLDHG